jgi:hypothetical protein
MYMFQRSLGAHACAKTYLYMAEKIWFFIVDMSCSLCALCGRVDVSLSRITPHPAVCREFGILIPQASCFWHGSMSDG